MGPEHGRSRSDDASTNATASLGLAGAVAIAAAIATPGCRSVPNAEPAPAPVAVALPSPGGGPRPDAAEGEADDAVPPERLRLLVVRDGDVLAVDPRAETPPETVLTGLDGVVRSVRTIEGGHAVLVMMGRPGPGGGSDALWRAEAGLPMRVDEQPRAQGALGAISALDPAGRTLVLHEPTPASTGGVLKLLRLRGEGEPSPVELLETRFHGGSDVSDDGTHVLVSGVPTSCTKRSLGQCPLHVWGMSLEHQELQLERRSDPRTRVAYHPHFEPAMAASYAFTFQTTAQDASRDCRDDLNACRHDIVLRPWAGGRGEIVREHALGPYVAPGNEARAHLGHERCDELPCDELTLHVSYRGEESVVAHGVVMLDEHMWSPDGRWLAWEGQAPGAGDGVRAVRVVHLPDGQVYTLGPGTPHAWMRLD